MNECNHISRFYPFSEQLGSVLNLNNMEAVLFILFILLSPPKIMTVSIASLLYCINPQVR